MRTGGAIALLVLAAASEGAATPADREGARLAREARENPEYYNCGLVRDVAGGRLAMDVQVELDGHPSHYNFWWEGGAADAGLSMRYSWSGTGYGPVERWNAVISFATDSRPGLARMMLRGPNGQILYEDRYFWNGGRSRGSRARYYRLEVPAQLFTDVIRTPGGITVELDGRTRLIAGRIDAAPLDGAITAIEAARGEIEAQIAAYRNRCRPGRNQEIIVT